jgi:hypothetical protein
MRTKKDSAVLLDKRGRVEHDDEKFNKPGVLSAYAGDGFDALNQDGAVPEHVKRNLDKASEVAGPFEPRNSIQTWEEALYAPTADGTAVTGSSEAIMVPIFTLPANYLYVGRMLKWTLIGRQSTVITTPGTITLRLSYSATGLGAVALATSGAFAPDPTAAATNLTWMVEWWTMCRSTGTAGTAIAAGRVEWTDYDDASLTTVVGNLGMRMAPTSAPATAAIDTTVARALSPTYQSSVATASMTTHMALLEAVT